MAFSIDLHKDVEKQVRKVFLSQLQRSVEDLDSCDKETEEKIHDLRKRCKKLRGLLRLVRPELKDDDLYDDHNRYFKEVANTFSSTRDQQVMRDTFEKILYTYRLDRDRYADIEKWIDSMQESSIDENAVRRDFDIYAAQYEANKNSAERYRLEKKGKHALDKGLKKAYKKARKLQKRAFETRTDEDFHEWRKWVKYHWYQMRLVRKNMKCLLDARVKRLKRLSDILGDEHDLTVFKSHMRTLQSDVKEDFFIYLQKERDTLRKEAKKMGNELFCVKPETFVHYLHALMKL